MIMLLTFLAISFPFIFYQKGYSDSYSKRKLESLQQFYYIPTKRPSTRSSLYELTFFLENREWVAEYEGGVFDCSEMSAFMERELENDGWLTRIVTGDNPAGKNEKHAWLLVAVVINGTWLEIPIETTSHARIITPESPYYLNYFEYSYAFQNICEALAFDYEEFNWWEN